MEISDIKEGVISINKELELLKKKRYDKYKSKIIKSIGFKKGDIVYNVTGVIRITGFDICLENYNGYGELLQPTISIKGDCLVWFKGGYVKNTKTYKEKTLDYYGVDTIKKIHKKKFIKS